MPSPFLTAAWERLVMANYIVDAALLTPYLPHKTELDIFNGKVYVSLVGFMFMNTRILGLKIPFHVNFEEVNLRFYVRYHDNGEWKRGTVFIKEIVPKWAISFVANTIYHEKYATKRMRNRRTESGNEMTVSYHWKHARTWNRIEATVDKLAQAMVPGSAEEFIAEHYWGYSKYNDTTTFEYEVQHPAWKIFPVKNYSIECDFKGLYGVAFSELAGAKPDSVFVAEGSAIAVLKKRRL
ncbi:MAG: DUF2071 domain-containing protein [Ferruginibacter sp.]